MPISVEELEQATKAIELPEDAGELSKARGDSLDGETASKTPESAETELSETDKADAEAAVKDLVDKKDEEEEPPRDEQGRFIPKARFDDLRKKKDAKIAAAEQRVRELEEQLKSKEGPQTVQEAEKLIDEKTEQYHQLLADGKLTESKTLLREIRALDRQLVKLELQPHLVEATRGSVQANTLADVVELYTGEFPEFAEGEAKNQEFVNEVAELQSAFEALGHSPAAALKKAADTIVAKYHLVPLSERATAKPTKAAEKAAERKTEAVKANLKAAEAQPPKIDALGTDSDKIGASNVDVQSLTIEEFEKLPESTIKRLRGDYGK